MTTHLFRFGYTWPNELVFVEANPGADLKEDSSCVFVVGLTEALAADLGELVAEAFVEALYGEDAYSWQAMGFASWIETDADIIAWATDNRVPVCRTDADIPRVVREMIRTGKT